MKEDRFQELCQEFVLSGLEGGDLHVFQEELERRGTDGQEILARTMQTVGMLALSAEPEDPPPGLRERLISEVQADARQVEDSDNSSISWITGTLLAAATVAALVFGLWNVNLRTDLADRTAALEEAQQELQAVDSLREELVALRQDLGTMVSPTGSMINLAGTENRPAARARIFVDPETGRALVLAYDLPILSPESIYQLWAIRDGEPFSVGTFAGREEGPARLDLDSLESVEGADLLAVTIEPAPGQPAPTGEMVLISGD